MIRLTVIALGVALVALGLSATGAGAQTAPATNPTAAARASRGASDEPGAAGPVVERHSERAAQASEHKISDADIATAPVVEQAKASHHTVGVGGKTIGYTATAGTLTLRDDDGKPIASMFYVAYVADGPKDANRPVTFSYNGGPGSASLFVHMGLAGPMHVMTDSPGATRSAPFQVVENHETLLDKSDLVFLDAIGAGYSRPLGDTKGTTFWGVDQDIDAFARGIQRYVTINHRWNSPKFLFGESYGTTRSAGLVYALQERGLQFNGVLLLSSVLNYGAHDAGFDHSYVSYVPSFAATAVYWKKAPQPADLGAYLQQVRDWASGPYLTALTKGANISDAEFDATAKQLSAYTGLSEQFIKEAHLRVDLSRFRKELLRGEHRTLGRYDTRFTGIDADDAGESAEFDPSDAGIHGAYVAALHDWLEQGLGYATELNYWPSGPGINQAWDWKHKPPGGNGGPGGRKEPVANTAADLALAMRENPHLKVYSLNGLYDMATPFFGTEYDLAHMWLDPSLRGNVRFAYYPSGHMVYLNQDALKQLKADVARFYEDATAR